MFSSETKIRVRYAETDQMGTVYHSNYFYYFEAARAEAIRDLGFTYAEMEEMGILMPVVDLQASFQRPAFYDDLLTVKTYLKELPSDHKIEFHHEVFNEKNTKVLVFVNFHCKKMPKLMKDHNTCKDKHQRPVFIKEKIADDKVKCKAAQRLQPYIHFGFRFFQFRFRKIVEGNCI